MKASFFKPLSNILEADGKTIICDFKPKYIVLADRKYNNNSGTIENTYDANDGNVYAQDWNGTVYTNISIGSGQQFEEILPNGVKLGSAGSYSSTNTIFIAVG